MSVAVARETKSVYRTLLRSVQHAFCGDVEMIGSARKEIRNRIEEAKSVSDSSELHKLHAEGREAAEFLKTSIVQSSQNSQGHWEVDLEEQHAGGVVEPILPGMKLPKEKKGE